MTYQPTTDLYEGIASAFPLELFPWDAYFARMAETDVLCGNENVRSVHSYFIRKAPFGGSYALLGGITRALRTMRELNFNDPDFELGMRERNHAPQFIRYLKEKGGLKDIEVYAPPEGTPFFPNEPIISIAGPSPQVRLADGILIGKCNFASLSLTKWHRFARVVRPGAAFDFSLRRAQNQMESSLYAILGGCAGTSNCELSRHFKVSVVGTMGHEWMESFPTVHEAFDVWLTHQPHLPVGLVDTVRCMEVDFPAWLDALYKHREQVKAANPAIWASRDDSGDLAYLSIEQYVRFLAHPLAEDPWFVERMRTMLTNELDEYRAADIIAQVSTQARAAGLDSEDILRRVMWAAGTRTGTCIDDPSIGAVAKQTEWNGLACIKLALDADGRVGVKTSLPGFNRSGMIRNAGEFPGVLIYPDHRYAVRPSGVLYDKVRHHDLKTLEAVHPDNESLSHAFGSYAIEPRQELVLANGELTEAWERTRPTIESVQRLVREATDALPWWMTQIQKSHLAPVSVTRDIFDLRARMIRRNALQCEYAAF
ncbi:MAG: hypothetical protein Q7S95_02420 [bacterium]|nr:hypothetical protein [bacterium]